MIAPDAASQDRCRDCRDAFLTTPDTGRQAWVCRLCDLPVCWECYDAHRTLSCAVWAFLDDAERQSVVAAEAQWGETALNSQALFRAAVLCCALELPSMDRRWSRPPRVQ